MLSNVRVLMIRIFSFLALAATALSAYAIDPPTNVVTRAGDQSIVLHWDKNSEPDLAGYRAYRSTTSSGGPFTLQTPSLLTSPGYSDQCNTMLWSPALVTTLVGGSMAY